MAITTPELDQDPWDGTLNAALRNLDARAETHPPGERLIIYYSYPTGANNLFSVDRVAALFSRWDLVVFGQPLQEQEHEEHANAVAVIAKIHAFNPAAKVFGYVSLALGNGDSAPLTDAEIRARVDAWAAMGVDGMLLDEAGGEYLVTRSRQNMALDYVHDQDLVALLNVWVQPDVFCPHVDELPADLTAELVDRFSVVNPGNIASTALPGDYTLLESWVVATDFDFYQPNGLASIYAIRNRADHARRYRADLGVKWLGSGTVDYGPGMTAAERRSLFNLNEDFARLFGADGWGIDALDYASNTSPSTPGNLAAVQPWGFDRAPLPRNAAYDITFDWLHLARHDLQLTLDGTSVEPGEAVWTSSNVRLADRLADLEARLAELEG